MHLRHIDRSVEHLLSYSEIASRNQFYEDVAGPGVSIQEFQPDVAASMWHPESTNAVLATRDDSHTFGVTQTLHSIIRAGNSAFGIAEVSMPKYQHSGQLFVVKLHDTSTYEGRPTFIAPVIPELTIDIALITDKDKKIDDDSIIEIGMNKSSDIVFGMSSNMQRIAQWITAKDASAIAGEYYNPLDRDVNSWSLPPKFLIAILKDTNYSVTACTKQHKLPKKCTKERVTAVTKSDKPKKLPKLITRVAVPIFSDRSLYDDDLPLTA